MRRWAQFFLVLVVVCGGGVALWTALASDPNVVRAVRWSGLVAVAAQLASFGVARWLVGEKWNVFAAWGAGSIVRFVALGVWALVAVKVLQLDAGPALVSYAVFVVLTTIVEPVFLTEKAEGR